MAHCCGHADGFLVPLGENLSVLRFAGLRQALARAQAAEELEKKVAAAENKLGLQAQAFQALESQMSRLKEELHRSSENFDEQMASVLSRPTCGYSFGRLYFAFLLLFSLCSLCCCSYSSSSNAAIFYDEEKEQTSEEQ